MRWRREYDYSRPLRPKVRRLKADEKEELLAKLNKAIQRSPVLRAFRVEAKSVRGRFYLYWHWTQEAEAPSHPWGRITPLDEPSGALLLEIEYRQGRWSEVAKGSPQKLVNAVAGDRKGTFHGSGALDKSLRKAEKSGGELRVKKSGKNKFIYADTGEALSVQEALYHYFRLPIQVIAQPVVWYSRHRQPYLAEYSKDGTRVLVRFTSSNWSAETFGGTCLYLKNEGEWGAYTIKPSESDAIASAERWLVKRKWEPWC